MNTLTHSELILSSPLPLDQNPSRVYIASLPADTGKRSQWQALRVIAQVLDTDPDTLNWSALRYQHTAAIRSRLAAEYAPATVNKILSALRQTLEQAWLLGQMDVDDYMRAIKLDPVTGDTLPAGRELSTAEIRALIFTCKADANTQAGTRDAAIIALMYTTGMRRDEVVSLSLASYDPETGQVSVTGKRNSQRIVYIINGAAEALADWLRVRGADNGALFSQINKTGRISSMESLSPYAIYKMLAKRALQAGIKKFSPHDLRRTFVSHLLDSGADIATVAKIAGHKNVRTTQRYDRRPEEAKKKAASLLHVPY